MTNTDTSNTNPVPMKQGINVIGVATALIALLVAFGINITPDQRTAILTLLAVVIPAVLALIHTFINHPANVQAALAYGRKMEEQAKATAKKGAHLFIACLLVTTMLAGCATVGTGPGVILSGLQAGFNTALLVYQGVCALDSGASFCTANDQATAAQLEQAVTNAIAAAQVAISGNLANIPQALQDVQNAVQAFENFVNHMQSAKAAKLAAKMRAAR